MKVRLRFNRNPNITLRTTHSVTQERHSRINRDMTDRFTLSHTTKEPLNAQHPHRSLILNRSILTTTRRRSLHTRTPTHRLRHLRMRPQRHRRCITKLRPLLRHLIRHPPRAHLSPVLQSTKRRPLRTSPKPSTIRRSSLRHISRTRGFHSNTQRIKMRTSVITGSIRLTNRVRRVGAADNHGYSAKADRYSAKADQLKINNTFQTAGHSTFLHA